MLLVETAANDNDWDGAAGMGQLNAIMGDLEIRDNDEFPFTGTVNVAAGRTLFAIDFTLQFEPGSTLSLTNGRYYSDLIPFGAADFAGTVIVNAGGPSTLQTSGGGSFENGSTTTLNDDLLLRNNSTFIEVGAMFAGDGALINMPNQTLALDDGVSSDDFSVMIENRGVLRLGRQLATAGQVAAVDLQQTATGRILLDVGGTAASDFDQLTLTGLASLDGTLDLTLFGGFAPMLGNTFNFLSAAGGVTGAFAEVEQPSGMPAGLEFDVVYSPTLVQLVVGRIFSADFDVDGDVDADDLAQWQDDFGLNGDSDADGDGDSDGADFLAWQQQLGSGVPIVAAAGALPEPATWALAIVTFAIIGGIRSRRRACRVS
jgi:hypothetical protein